MSISRRRTPQRAGQLARLAQRARGGAEAGHGDGEDARRAAGRAGRTSSRTRAARAWSRARRRGRGSRACRPVCSSRLASPAVWIAKISWQRSSSVAGSAGTKGCGSTARTRRCGPRRRDRAQARRVRYAPRQDVHAVGERRLARALHAQPLGVHVGDDEVALALEALALPPAGSRSPRSAGARRTRRRWWTRARRCSRRRSRPARARRLHLDQLAAVLRLGHQLVRRRTGSGARSRPPRRAGCWAAPGPTGPRRSRPPA